MHEADATTGYWQQLLDAAPADVAPPWRRSVPVALPDGRWLRLPIRPLPAEPEPEVRPEPGHAVASLLCNHASLAVLDALGELLARQLAPLGAEVVVGLPTLGLALAPIVARQLGHARYVPLGYSRKFWYDDALSAAVVSITSPGAAKRVYLDPHLLPLVRGRRVLLVDDAVSSGRTARAPWDLLQSLGAEVLALGVAMRQGQRWRAELGPERAARVEGVFDSPLLRATPAGWVPRD
ncbi:MAG: phosphoribosyltransferase [Proteobacteria bacterium]|nr:phosphoribosyltransferase [Pseudomonadota bacterium]